MIIEILDEAEQDLVNGFSFYERQSKGSGTFSILSFQMLNHSISTQEFTCFISDTIAFLPTVLG